MSASLFAPPGIRTAADIATLAVAALRAEADLTPKPGLVDARGPGVHRDMDLALLHASAESLRVAFTDCATAATQCDPGLELRVHLGEIGRTGERTMLAATGGVNTHRGALWALGLLSAGAATARSVADVIGVAATLALLDDPALTGAAPPPASHGALARRRFGVAGAVGQAQAGFPAVRLHACRRCTPPAAAAPTKPQPAARPCYR